MANILDKIAAKSTGVKCLIAALSVAAVAGAGAGVYALSSNSGEPAHEVTATVEASESEESKEQIAANDPQETEEAQLTEESKEEQLLVEESEEESEEEEEEVGEEKLVKHNDKLLNGNFADGLDWFELYAYNEYDMSSSVANKTLAVTIADTGDEDWHIQLKQGGIRLQQGKWYKLTLDAKSDLNRTIGCIMQRDGAADNNWTPYSKAGRFALTNKWQTYTIVFQMNEKTDPDALFNLSMGTVDGKKIAKEHTVSIRNIALTTMADNWMDALKSGDNLITDPTFAYEDVAWEGSVVAPGAANVSFKNNKAVFDISNPGTVDWHVQMKQANINLEQGNGYKLTFKASSTAARTIKIGFMDTNYVNWYGGGDVVIGPTETEVSVPLYMDKASNANTLFMLSMGKIEGVNTPASTITLSDFKLVKDNSVNQSNAGGGAGWSGPNPFTSLTDGWGLYDHEDTHAGLVCVDGENGFRIDVTNTGTEEWHVQLQKKNVTLEKDKYYKVSFEAKSTKDRTIGYMLQRDGSADNNWITYSLSDGSDKPALTSEWQSFGQTFKMTSDTDTAVGFNFSLGLVNGISEPAHTVWIRNIVLEEAEAPAEKTYDVGDEIFENVSFANGGAKWNLNCAPSNGTVTAGNNAVTFDISDVGTNEWDVQLKQSGLKLEQGCKYRVTFNATAAQSRVVKLGFLSTSYAWYGGSDLSLTAGQTLPVSFEFTMNEATDDAAFMQLSMGQMYSDPAYQNPIDTPACAITLSDFSLTKIAEAGAPDPGPGNDNYVAVILPTDEKNNDGNIVKIFNPYEYLAGYKDGDNIKITAKLSSDGAYSGFLGMCYSPTASWDNNFWTNCPTQEIGAGQDSTWELTVNGAMGDIQLQIFYIGGTSINVTELTVEKVEDESNNDPSTNPNDPADHPLFTGTLNTATGNAGFMYNQYLSDVQIGDAIAITVKFECSADSWGGGVGAVDNGADGWKQVPFDNNTKEVTLEFTAGKDENGNLNAYAEIQPWWPEGADINYSVLSIVKK